MYRRLWPALVWFAAGGWCAPRPGGICHGVPALLRLSDSGVRLDSGLRRVLEGAFCVDLSGVRLHAGPRTDAFLRVHGCSAAAAGHRVFMPAIADIVPATMGIVSADSEPTRA
jgi:hypothetical protein